MSKDNKTIHEFDFSLICEYFSGLDRQGPGSTESTIKALRFIDNLNSNSKIADLGCGTGAQTMILGQNSEAQITAVDLSPDFINILNQNAINQQLQDRIKGVIGSMDDLHFSDNELDVIWSEGAIYNIGFERGITEWHRFLKKDGYLAVTEASWFTNERPSEITEFWLEAYPQIDTIANNVAKLQNAGYIPVATFIIPENCWLDNFYVPQKQIQQDFLNKYPENETVTELIKNQRREAELYNKYKAYYGYVFYIARKM